MTTNRMTRRPRWSRPSGHRFGTRHLFASALALLAVLLAVALPPALTARSLAGDSVGWRVETKVGADAERVRAALQALSSTEAGLRAVDEIGVSSVPNLEVVTSKELRRTATAAVIGVEDDFRADFPDQIRLLAARPGGVLLGDETAATLQVGVGDTFGVMLPNGATTELRVDGLADISRTASLLRQDRTVQGPGATSVPDDVAIVPMSVWKGAFAGLPSARISFDIGFDNAFLSMSPKAARAQAAVLTEALRTAAHEDAVVVDFVGPRLAEANAISVRSGILFLLFAVLAVIVATVPSIGFLSAATSLVLAVVAIARRRTETRPNLKASRDGAN